MTKVAPTPSAKTLKALYDAVEELLDVFIGSGDLTDEEMEVVEMVDEALAAAQKSA